MSIRALISAGHATDVRAYLMRARDRSIAARRALVLASLTGMLSMTPVVLLQMGIVGHLPDPPWPSFDSDRVNRSPAAFRAGIPDGALAVAGFALNIPLATAGGRVRSAWLSALACAKTGIEAAVAVWYASLMPRKEKRWCAYCLAGMTANLFAFASTLAEGMRTFRRLRGA